MKHSHTFICIFTAVCSYLCFGCSDSNSSSSSTTIPQDTSELTSCADGTPCPDKTTCLDNLCKPQIEVGQACNKETTVCINSECIDGQCKITSTPTIVNCNGITCGPNQTCHHMVCTDAVAENESCYNSPCLTGYICDSKNTCKKASLIGEPCDANIICRVGTCTDKTCQVISEEDKLKTTDSDGDTISDFYDRCDNFSNSNDPSTPDCKSKDSDGDTIPDSVEARNNGDIYEEPLASYEGYDFMIPDTDGNGIPDGIEAGPDVMHPIDTDADTIPDYIVADNDSDGILDTMEIKGIQINTDSVKHYARKCDSNCDCDTDGYCKPGTSDHPWDTDNDGIPDYNSFDSDGDTISDFVEGTRDSDNDGTADRYSLDSDGDTIPDKDEVVKIDGQYIVQTSFQGNVLKDKSGHTILKDGSGKYYKQDDSGQISPLPDDEKPAQSFSQPLTYCAGSECIYCNSSLDCDKDGILDKDEGTCPKFGWAGASDDIDGDGYYDTAERAVAQYAIDNHLSVHGQTIEKAEDVICDPTITVKDFFDFYFELPYGGPQDQDVLIFTPSVSKLDVVFNMDTTSSMGAEVRNLQERIQSFIIPQVRSRVADTAIGVTHYDDFPTNGYGSASDNDLPFVVDSLLSTVDSEIIAGIQKLIEQNGAEPKESGMESLYQILKGDDASQPQTSWVAATTNDSSGSITRCQPPEGTWGCAGFREDTLPVIVTITDELSHDSDANMEPYNTAYVKNPHYSNDVVQAAKDKGARIISISAKQDYQYPQLSNISRQSNAVVPLCTFQNADGSWKCGENMCCTGRVSPEKDGTYPESGNKCVLNYGVRVAENMSETLVDGIDALIKYGTYDVSTKVHGLPLSNGKTTACFIKQVVASKYVAPPNPPESFCNPEAIPTKVVAENYNDGFSNFAPGTSSSSQKGSELHFTVIAQNDDCIEATDQVQVFEAYIDVINPTTGLSFGTRTVSIIVPAKQKVSDN